MLTLQEFRRSPHRNWGRQPQGFSGCIGPWRGGCLPGFWAETSTPRRNSFDVSVSLLGSRPRPSARITTEAANASELRSRVLHVAESGNLAGGIRKGGQDRGSSAWKKLRSNPSTPSPDRSGCRGSTGGCIIALITWPRTSREQPPAFDRH
jgi:hypothetical protein